MADRPPKETAFSEPLCGTKALCSIRRLSTISVGQTSSWAWAGQYPRGLRGHATRCTIASSLGRNAASGSAAEVRRWAIRVLADRD